MAGDAEHLTDQRMHWDQPVPLRWMLIDDEYPVEEPNALVAACADIEGLFVDPWPRPPEAEQPATLRGCRPGPPLSRALAALARGAGNPGGALHRRQVGATLHSVADNGTAIRLIGGGLHGSVSAVRPSAIGTGLLDVTFDVAVTDPLPADALAIWQLWWSGGPTEKGLWVGYDRELRHQWSAAALAHTPHGRPDQPAGTTYHLDGRNITDLDGFWCAIGEAVNGPGGYFGWNPSALNDCVHGRWGAAWPFRLVWHDSDVARTRLTGAPEDTFEQLCQWLTEDGIDLELRP